MRMSKCFIVFLTVEYLTKVLDEAYNGCKFEFNKALEIFGPNRMVFVNVEQTKRSIDNLFEETMNFIPVYIPLRTEQEIDKNFEKFVDWIQHAQKGHDSNENQEAIEEWEREAFIHREHIRGTPFSRERWFCCFQDIQHITLSFYCFLEDQIWC